MKKKMLGLGITIVVIAALAVAIIWSDKEDVADISQEKDMEETVISEYDTIEENSIPSSTEESIQSDKEELAEQNEEQENPFTVQEKAEESAESETPGELAESETPDASAKPEDSANQEAALVITTNSGVEIPRLERFNNAGLNGEAASDEIQDWFGDAGDIDSPGYIKVTECADAMNELTEAMEITGGFLPLQDSISFSFTDKYASAGDLVLRRDFDNGYYTIGINYDMSDAEGFYPTEDGKDALTLLCSVVSSTPVELAEFLYQESFVVEECMTSEDSWVAVGDCLVQWGGYNSNESDELVYKVKGK